MFFPQKSCILFCCPWHVRVQKRQFHFRIEFSENHCHQPERLDKRWPALLLWITKWRAWGWLCALCINPSINNVLNLQASVIIRINASAFPRIWNSKKLAAKIRKDFPFISFNALMFHVFEVKTNMRLVTSASPSLNSQSFKTSPRQADLQRERERETRDSPLLQAWRIH